MNAYKVNPEIWLLTVKRNSPLSTYEGTNHSRAFEVL